MPAGGTAGYVVRYTPNAVVHHRGGDGLVNPRLRAMMAVNKVREYRRRASRRRCVPVPRRHLGARMDRGLAGPAASREAALALLRPHRRPPELEAGGVLLPP